MKIGIDVDGVLANFCEGFQEVGRKLFGKDKFPQGYVPHDWNWTDIITKDEERLMWQELLKTSDFWTSLEPIEANVIALREFLLVFGDKHDVWFVTARAASGGPTQASQTSEWLERQFGYEANSQHRGVITVPKSDLKRQVLEGVGITYMIDDHGPTIESLDSLPQMNAYLLDAKWNQDALVKNRVGSMTEFLAKVEPTITKLYGESIADYAIFG